MLRSLKDLERYTVNATDGQIGTVANFLIDDQFWAIRYLVVDTGGVFEGRHVLISPVSFLQADWTTGQFHLALTRDKVKHSPDVDTEQPVSRQHELDHSMYYGYPAYWGASGVWGMTGNPARFALGMGAEPSGKRQAQVTEDVHLHSAMEVRGYHIQGSDGAIGHVCDFIVDDLSWEVRYLVVDTRNWWPGKRVLVSPFWASSISWEEQKVHLDLSRQTIKDCPEWDPNAAINREYETCMYDYYGRRVYWDEDSHPDAAQTQGPNRKFR